MGTEPSCLGSSSLLINYAKNRACLDVRVESLLGWTREQAFFDVKVFNLFWLLLCFHSTDSVLPSGSSNVLAKVKIQPSQVQFKFTLSQNWSGLLRKQCWSRMTIISYNFLNVIAIILLHKNRNWKKIIIITWFQGGTNISPSRFHKVLHSR